MSLNIRTRKSILALSAAICVAPTGVASGETPSALLREAPAAGTNSLQQCSGMEIAPAKENGPQRVNRFVQDAQDIPADWQHQPGLTPSVSIPPRQTKPRGKIRLNPLMSNEAPDLRQVRPSGKSPDRSSLRPQTMSPMAAASPSSSQSQATEDEPVGTGLLAIDQLGSHLKTSMDAQRQVCESPRGRYSSDLVYRPAAAEATAPHRNENRSEFVAVGMQGKSSKPTLIEGAIKQPGLVADSNRLPALPPPSADLGGESDPATPESVSVDAKHEALKIAEALAANNGNLTPVADPDQPTQLTLVDRLTGWSKNFSGATKQAPNASAPVSSEVSAPEGSAKSGGILMNLFRRGE